VEAFAKLPATAARVKYVKVGWLDGMGDVITETIQYWEPRRLIYNVALALLVLGVTFYYHPSLSVLVRLKPIVGLLVMAVVANALY
jgi:hypothetical protein